jgi:hypothetical protein
VRHLHLLRPPRSRLPRSKKADGASSPELNGEDQFASSRFQYLVDIIGVGYFALTRPHSRLATMARVNDRQKADAGHLVKLRGRALKNYEAAHSGPDLQARCGNRQYQIVAIPCLIAK